MSESTADVELRNLTVRAGSRLLLEGVSARFEPRKITLIVGPSGAGKSLLLRVLAGLLPRVGPEISIEGEACIAGHDVLAGGSGPGDVGVVFQNYALFDELSPLDNVRFAAAQRGAAARSTVTPQALLEELRVPRDVRTALLSGGQRQRLAIARTLAYDPRVILYDEPTSNLDTATGTRVAELIRATHAAHHKTSVIVTHDDRSLVPIADHIFLLDPSTRSLRELPREEWSRLAELLHPLNAALVTSGEDVVTPPKSAVARLGDFFVAASHAGEQAIKFPLRLVPRWRSTTWGLRYFMHYLRLVAGPSAWLYLVIAGAIAGFVATYFTFRFLPFRTYTEPLLIDDLLHVLGFIIYRVTVPLLVTVLIAARCGAAVASDVGNKVYGRQINALRTLHANPESYLATNIVYAFLLGTLFLTVIAFVAARVTSLLVFVTTHPEFGPFFWKSHFDHVLRAPGELFFRGTGWLVAKLLLSAAGIALISYHRGLSPKHSSTEVSDGITSTVLWATLYVLFVHLVFALFEFEGAVPQ